MDLVLKQFDDILLHFTAKRTIDGIDVAITSTNKAKAKYLPLGNHCPVGCGTGRFLQTELMLRISYQKMA